MNQLFTQIVVCAGVATFFLSCQSPPNCHELVGSWTNREGKLLQFKPDGQALWLTKFGSEYDTFSVKYRLDCTQKQPTLDLLEFRAGPMAGKTLFGIIEWSNDSVFRFEAEPGTSPEARPLQFNAQQIERFYRME